MILIGTFNYIYREGQTTSETTYPKAFMFIKNAEEKLL